MAEEHKNDQFKVPGEGSTYNKEYSDGHKNYGREIDSIMAEAVKRNASDIHLTANVPVMFRIDGRLEPFQSELDNKHSESIILSFMDDFQKERLKREKEVDFSFSYVKDVRFRVNVFYQRGDLSASMRLIPSKIKTFEELGLPPVIEKFITPSQGFVIVTGPTGHGKSTTLASMVDYINHTRKEHIITIEDPIEYMFHNDKSVIEQREVYSDTRSFARALRSALREDPNVILIGEMRDLETISAALTLAETGHLVYTTLHTNDAAQTADRIIDVFPPHQQQQVRQQLANVLLGVVSQRLLPRTSGGRIIACEILIANNAIRNVIREGKTHQLPNIIQTSVSEGMITLDKVLSELVSKGEVSLDDALAWASDPKSFKMKVY
ncbi:type IV pilus twitching motility protein PilT [Patescibacteria group bacterium]|nr:type IV pilus twitching motility protein PilT [Patescibacteria group bacterium]